MKRIILAFVVAVLAAIPVAAGHTNVLLLAANIRPLQWTSTDDSGKVSPLQTHCTIFSVNPEHQGWMTAAHCVQDPDTGMRYTDTFTIDGHPAHVVDVDVEDDLALVQTEDWGLKTGFKLAAEGPKTGDMVETMGYSWGIEHPLYFIGAVSSTEQGMYVFGGMTVIGGQSGSPVVNAKGQVIGVVHAGISDNPFGSMSPIVGFTPFSVLKAYDRGWVFSR